MESLCETHTAIKTLITELELPVTEWDAKWIDVYLDITVKLLDICIAFSSEISRLSQGHLFLQCALHKLECNTSEKLMRACSSLDSWRQHIGSKNPRLGNCKSILDSLVDSLTLPKVKNSAKVDSENLLDLDVPSTISWAQAYSDLQTTVNGEIREVFSRGKFTFLKELDEVDAAVNNLYPMVQDGMRPTEMKAFRSSFSDLGGRAEKLSQVLDVLAKEVDGFFKIVLSGRDALLCNLRVSDTVADPFPGNSGEQVRG
ncbi:hypothetical protein OIU77_010388 [Salix suchowensis]|uniref:Uncharacterized protein n=1 Tax=Salix suchowensis TaxID=1278906 RepID=A0ABQ9A865_9ROSI|nr:hypothetical protein OIU77_010388 [Salix suchowensis]